MRSDHHQHLSVSVSRCGDYRPAAVTSALAEALAPLGGIGSVVSAGDTVLLNPNLLSPRDPAEAVTTHPVLVKAVATACFVAGAERVLIGDSCAGDHPDEKLWDTTGMREVATETGATLVSFSACAVAARAVGNRQVPVPGWLTEVDVVISLPKLKTHALTVLTCAMKNTYGMICGGAKAMYHANFPSPRSMSSFLLDVYAALKPDLVIVDGVIGMEGEGPANGKARGVGVIVAGRDGCAVDLICAGLIGIKAEDVPMLREAGTRGWPGARLENVLVTGPAGDALSPVRFKTSIGRLLQRIPEPLFKLATRLLACRPGIDAETCIKCGVCARICSQKAIRLDRKKDRYVVDSARCILCMCCAESCPHHAIYVRSPLRLYRAMRRLARRV